LSNSYTSEGMFLTVIVGIAILRIGSIWNHYGSVAAYCQDPLEGWRQTMLRVSVWRTRERTRLNDHPL
jgi:hypothetical protein